MISISAIAAVLMQLIAPARAAAQTQSDSPSRTWLADRHDLESRAALADNEGRAQDAASIRARLRDGDFRVGDRLIVSVRDEPSLSDTFTVRDGLLLKLPDMPELSLRGVLRSEVEQVVGGRIGEFFRNREVRVMPLVSIGVLGQVAKPGFYQLPADALLSDALMAAGGPTAVANPDRMTVRRGGQTLLDARQVRDVVATGATLESLALHSGDAIVIDERQQTNWATIAQVGSIVSSLIVSIVWVTRR